MTDPKHTHAWEQFMAAASELAVTLGKYRQDLEDAGFSRAEAVGMACHLQHSLLSGASRPKDSDGEDWKRG